MGVGVGAGEGEGVGAYVGEALGVCEGTGVGMLVGGGIGVAVGGRVGANDRVIVTVGGTVGLAVGERPGLATWPQAPSRTTTMSQLHLDLDIFPPRTLRHQGPHACDTPLARRAKG